MSLEERLDRRQDILHTVHALAAEFAKTYPIRDARNEFPYEEVARLKTNGLLTLSIPEAYGGLELPFRDLVECVLTLATGNPSVAQMFLVHCVGALYVTELVPEAQRRVLLQAVTARNVFLGNAVSERYSKSKYELDTVFLPTPDKQGVRIRGKKFFSTGSLASDLIMVVGTLNNSMAVAFVPRDTEGLHIRDDWRAMGQRGTASGTTEFQDAFVGWDMIVPGVDGGGGMSPASLLGPMTQICFAAIFVGTAKGALTHALEYVKTKTRPWVLGGVNAAVEDPYILQQAGQMRAAVSAAESLVYRAVTYIDHALTARESGAGEEAVRRRGEASVAVAEAKVFATEVALRVCQDIFRICGARAALADEDFDRFWRDVRTLTLHDPVDYKERLIGAYLLQDQFPPASFIT